MFRGLHYFCTPSSSNRAPGAPPPSLSCSSLVARRAESQSRERDNGFTTRTLFHIFIYKLSAIILIQSNDLPGVGLIGVRPMHRAEHHAYQTPYNFLSVHIKCSKLMGCCNAEQRPLSLPSEESRNNREFRPLCF